MILMPGEDHTPLMVYVGYAKNEDGEVIKGAEITAFDEETGEMFGTYTPNPRTGKFVLAGEEGTKLQLLIEADGYKPIERNIVITDPEKQNKDNMIAEVAMEDIEMQNAWVIPVNIFMPFDSFKTDMEAYGQLVEFLQQNNSIDVKLIGHTDAKGPEWYNQKLGRQRAEFVKKHLIHNNIHSTRIETISKGESDPLAKNTLNGEDAPEGRKFNRRVEVKLLNADSKVFEIKATDIPQKLLIKRKN